MHPCADPGQCHLKRRVACGAAVRSPTCMSYPQCHPASFVESCGQLCSCFLAVTHVRFQPCLVDAMLAFHLEGSFLHVLLLPGQAHRREAPASCSWAPQWRMERPTPGGCPAATRSEAAVRLSDASSQRLGCGSDDAAQSNREKPMSCREGCPGGGEGKGGGALESAKQSKASC